MEPGLSRQHFFAFWKRMMVFWWLMFPFALFAPAWNAVHARPDEHGLWVGYAILGVPVLALWVWMFKTGRVLWRLMDIWHEEDMQAARDKALKDELTMVRARRLERAQARLARIELAQIQAGQAELVDDLLELREDLSDPS